MVLRMTRPTQRKESSNHLIRKRIPTDILTAAQGHKITLQFPSETPGEAPDERSAVTFKRQAIKVSLTTRDKATAKLRTALAESQLEAAFEAIRHGPTPLTHKQIVALSGRVYRWFTGLGEDNP